jgi:hypothetical protein
MQDNDRIHPVIQAALIQHIGANGRWFMICMVIVSIAASLLFQAVVFAAMLGAIHLIEGLTQPGRDRQVMAALVYLVIIGNLITVALAVRP